MLQVFLNSIEKLENTLSSSGTALKNILVNSLLQFAGQESALFKNCVLTLSPEQKVLLESSFKSAISQQAADRNDFESQAKAPKIQLKNFGDF
jgi:hypothetical protein